MAVVGPEAFSFYDGAGSCGCLWRERKGSIMGHRILVFSAVAGLHCIVDARGERLSWTALPVSSVLADEMLEMYNVRIRTVVAITA